MGLFAYKGRNADGALVEGVLEASDSGSAATQLFSSGVTPVHIGETDRSAKTQPNDVLLRLTRRKVGLQELLLFSRQMYTLLKAGVPIMRALAGLQDSTANPTFRDTLQRIRESLDAGKPLSTSMGSEDGVFSRFYVAMVYVGETTGMLEEIFLRLFHHLEFQELMRAQVRSALRYPSFVIATIAVAIVVINVWVIPAFAKVYAGFNAELPLATRMLIALSHFMANAWWMIGLASLVAGAGFHFWTRTEHGRLTWDRIKLRLPISGKIVLKASLARFARSFSVAIRSGVPIVHGLTLVGQTVGNAHVARQIEKMRASVERGESVLRSAANVGVFTPVVLQMIMVGEESGALDDMMDEIAEMYQRDVEYELRALGAQIEPVLIILLGVLVLTLALGVFLPVWDLGTAALSK
ncbi:MAG: type II secretion system F family protein [Betaproteobacteria bacterium]|jgi:MSHA biogenesis protein MshG|nr:MAG: type II secretion system F family protein [Betaproteobacteria bacterium]